MAHSKKSRRWGLRRLVSGRSYAASALLLAMICSSTGCAKPVPIPCEEPDWSQLEPDAATWAELIEVMNERVEDGYLYDDIPRWLGDLYRELGWEVEVDTSADDAE